MKKNSRKNEEELTEQVENEKIFRRQLRAQQRKLNDEINDNLDKIQVAGNTLFSNLRDRNNEIFEQVNNPRELYLDAGILTGLARSARIQTSSMDDVSRRYDFDTFAERLQEHFMSDEGYIDWNRLGKDCGTLFRTIPPFNVMRGLLGKESVPKVRKQVEKRGPKDTSAADKPEEIFQGNVKKEGKESEDDDVNEATTVRLNKLMKLLETHAVAQTGKSEDEKVKLRMLDLLVDTSEIGGKVQTIENFFDYSFLVKEKKVVMGIISEEDPTPIAMFTNKLHEEHQNHQHVLTVGMKDLHEAQKLLTEIKQLEAALELSKSGKSSSSSSARSTTEAIQCVLHRDDELYSTLSARDQADILSTRR